LPSFKQYAKQIVRNSNTLAKSLIKKGYTLVGGGSENHLLLIDLTPQMGSGAGIFVQQALEYVGITVNKNTIPNEQSSPFYPSGVRLGTPAVTTRGMKEKEMEFIAECLHSVIQLIKDFRLPKEKEERKITLRSFTLFLKKSSELKKISKEVRNRAQVFYIP